MNCTNKVNDNNVILHCSTLKGSNVYSNLLPLLTFDHFVVILQFEIKHLEINFNKQY